MRWFLPSWTCVLWTRQPLVIRSHCLYFTDKWIWQRNCLGKAIPQASQQLLPSFFTSIAEGKGRIWQLLLYQGDTETITCIAWSQSSSFPPLCRMDTCRKLPLHYKHFERVCSHERQTDRQEGGRQTKAPECFHYLRVPLLFRQTHPSVSLSMMCQCVGG